MFGGPVAALAVGAGPPEPIRSATATSAAALSAHFVMTATSPGCGPILPAQLALRCAAGGSATGCRNATARRLNPLIETIT